MARIFIFLFVIFSLVAAPVVHAAGLDCVGTTCKMTEQAKKKDNDKKQDTSKISEHHCCTHLSYKINPLIGHFPIVASKIVAIPSDDAMTSIVLGPPLEPPSYA